MKATNKNPYSGKMLLTNNDRRRAGIATHRKTNRKKKYFTRCEAAETIDAFLNFCNYSEE